VIGDVAHLDRRMSHTVEGKEALGISFVGVSYLLKIEEAGYDPGAITSAENTGSHTITS
jgi:hypothetical protein